MVAGAVAEFAKLDLAANVAGVPQQPFDLADTTLALCPFTGLERLRLGGLSDTP